MSKKGDFTNQHIVPVSYLRRFAEKGKSTYRIGVIQRGKRHYIDAVENVGYIKNYYDISFLDDVKHWEHYFNNEIESPCRMPMTNLIAKAVLSVPNRTILSDNDRLIMSKFIITQFLRVPSFIDYHILDFEEKIEEYKSQIIDSHPFSQEQLDVIKGFSFSKDEKRNIILSGITDPTRLNRYCRIVANKPWVVYVNCTALPFITSDNPVVMTNIRSHSNSRSDNGIGNENTILFFPVSPRIALGIYPYRYAPLIEECDGKSVYLYNDDLSMIDKMNKVILAQCYKQCFVPLDFYKDLYQE